MSDCLQDILISELPKTGLFDYEDLLVIDVKKAGTNAYETKAIKWGFLSGVYPPSPDGNGNGGNGGDDIDNEIILRGQVKFLDGTELRPSITFIRDDNTGFYRPRDNTIGVTTGGTRCMVWSEQRVGIGTDYPEEMLHVDHGNVLIRLGDNDNDLYLGSSTRTTGGDPSVQSVGPQPLTFHVNRHEWLRINQYGAFGLRYGILVDFGKENMVLSSDGPESSVRWRRPEELMDLNQILEDIDNNMIGKGEFDVLSEGTQKFLGPSHDIPNQGDPQDYTTMSSGIDVETLLGGVVPPIIDPDTGKPIIDEDCLEHPNANSFYDSGWYIQVDDSVVRTNGYQTIDNLKKIRAEFKITEGGNINLRPDGNFDFHRIKTLPFR